MRTGTLLPAQLSPTKDGLRKIKVFKRERENQFAFLLPVCDANWDEFDVFEFHFLSAGRV